jgi:hypothetical protein
MLSVIYAERQGQHKHIDNKLNWRHNAQYNNTQHNDIHHNDK